MRELTLAQQQTLHRLLEQKEFARALITLVDIALQRALDNPQISYLEFWKHQRQAVTPLQTPAFEVGDDLATMLVNYQTWSALDLLKSLENALRDRRITKRRFVWPVTSESGNDYWLIRKHAWPKTTRADRLPYTLNRVLEYWHVIPVQLSRPAALPMTVELIEPDAALGQKLVGQQEEPTEYIGHFPQGIEFQTKNCGGAIVLEDIKCRESHQAELSCHLRHAAHTTFFVLPECTVCPDMREALKREIATSGKSAPLVSVVGSFHEYGREHSEPYNITTVLDPRGEVLFQHAKTAAASLGQEGDEGIRTN